MAEVGKEFTLRLDMGDAESVGGSWGIGEGEDLMARVQDAFEGIKGGFRQAVVAAFVQLHSITKNMSEEASASSTGRTFLSPRDYLALIHNFVVSSEVSLFSFFSRIMNNVRLIHSLLLLQTCVNNQREQIEDEQLHVNAGLSKLRQTQENVAELKTSFVSQDN